MSDTLEKNAVEELATLRAENERLAKQCTALEDETSLQGCFIVWADQTPTVVNARADRLRRELEEARRKHREDVDHYKHFIAEWKETARQERTRAEQAERERDEAVKDKDYAIKCFAIEEKVSLEQRARAEQAERERDEARADVLFYMGEGDVWPPEDEEWKRLSLLADRTPEQAKRLQELTRIITDKTNDKLQWERAERLQAALRCALPFVECCSDPNGPSYCDTASRVLGNARAALEERDE
jgi:hypothetical protein